MNIYSHFMNYMFLNTKHDIFNHKKSKWHKNVQRFSHKTWILDHKILIFDHKLKIIKHKTHIFLITNRYFSQKSYFYQNLLTSLIGIINDITVYTPSVHKNPHVCMYADVCGGETCLFKCAFHERIHEFRLFNKNLNVHLIIFRIFSEPPPKEHNISILCNHHQMIFCRRYSF